MRAALELRNDDDWRRRLVLGSGAARPTSSCTRSTGRVLIGYGDVLRRGPLRSSYASTMGAELREVMRPHGGSRSSVAFVDELPAGRCGLGVEPRYASRKGPRWRSQMEELGEVTSALTNIRARPSPWVYKHACR